MLYSCPVYKSPQSRASSSYYTRIHAVEERQMEGETVMKKPALMVYVAVMVVVAAAAVVMDLMVFPAPVESAFGIELDPCKLPKCISECKKALQEKYMSATCAMGAQKKFCICLG